MHLESLQHTNAIYFSYDYQNYFFVATDIHNYISCIYTIVGLDKIHSISHG